MIVPDVNLLLYANIDAYRQHAAARAWWQDCLNGDEEVGLAMPALFGFIRIATNRRVFATPMTATQAVERVEAWLALPRVRPLSPGSRHAEIALGLLRELGTAGDLTTDVQLAALAIEHRGTLYSNDADFRRLPGVKHVNPLA